MTDYHPNDLADGWEFKILRSSTAVFKNPERMRAILEDETKAGWVLVEKFDDRRIRLKRPASVGRMDAKLDFDPYRTDVGGSNGLILVVILAALFGLMFLAIFLRSIR